MKLVKCLVGMLFIIGLLGCSAMKVDMRSTDDSSISYPEIYSAARYMIPGDWISAEIIRVNHEVINPRIVGYKFVVDPGVHEVEMSWFSTMPPVTNQFVSSTNTAAYVGLGNGVGIVTGGNMFSPENTSVARINAKEGYAYFVNISPSLNTDGSFSLPRKLCVSELPIEDIELMTVSPGTVVSNLSAPIVACSQ